MTTAERFWNPGPYQQLPRRIPLFQNETIASFITRLAAANHIAVDDMHDHLGGWEPDRDWINLEWTSFATGYSIETLIDRLPGFTRPDLERLPIGTACRRCAVRRGVLGPVTIYRDLHLNVCLRHRLWIGGDSHATQKDVTSFPDLIRAQRQHNLLMHRHGVQTTTAAFTTASQALQHGTDFATYPDAVALTGILISERQPPPEPSNPRPRSPRRAGADIHQII
ncbi:hypothetical protein NONI108955_21500 [Nocardia ninae]|uniref:TniQ family protein n=1 Tax=Nocardia ninae NBRC 108245 TaxID=1210091 RepID=A0A511M741_9NOCA|nr:hypothetical protein [Nocardia ninae]GEM36465.1 hypothetical protein NN4_09840 [Nocardia ninae NBRC 108245]